MESSWDVIHSSEGYASMPKVQKPKAQKPVDLFFILEIKHVCLYFPVR
jgi:hypothetical protein